MSCRNSDSEPHNVLSQPVRPESANPWKMGRNATSGALEWVGPVQYVYVIIITLIWCLFLNLNIIQRLVTFWRLNRAQTIRTGRLQVTRYLLPHFRCLEIYFTSLIHHVFYQSLRHFNEYSHCQVRSRRLPRQQLLATAYPPLLVLSRYKSECSNRAPTK